MELWSDIKLKKGVKILHNNGNIYIVEKCKLVGNYDNRYHYKLTVKPENEELKQ
jgi:hypothetical protein